jgi:putative sterol carrier protein
VAAPVEATVTEPAEVTTEYDAKTQTLHVTAVSIPPNHAFNIQLNNPALTPDSRILSTCQKLVNAFQANSWTKQQLYAQLSTLIEDPTQLVQYELKLSHIQLRALAEVMTGAGRHHGSTRRSRDETIILWNNQENQDVIYRLAALGINGRSEYKREPLPKFGIFNIGENVMSFHEGNQPSVGKVTVSTWFDTLPEQIRRAPTSQEDIVVQFDISGENGRSAYLLRDDGEVQLIDGTHANPDVTIATTAADWLALLNGEVSPETMFLEGKITITGNLEFVLQLAGSINLSPPSTYRSDNWRLEINYFDCVRVV